MVVLDEFFDFLPGVCATFPDKRKGGDVIYSMADIGMAGFALFFMQSESFLAHQRSLEARLKTSNCQGLFGMRKIPTDNHIRSMLDPVPPHLLQPVFDHVMSALRSRGA